MPQTFIILFLFAFYSSAQKMDDSYHIIYLSSWTFDKNDPIPAQEFVALSLKGDASIFQKHNSRKRDSIITHRELTIEEEKNLKNLERYAIEFQGNRLTYYHTLGETEYQYEEILNHDWKLGSDTKTIKGYECRDATVSYGGRDWKAWYAINLPINVGPYKFRGLPGLIVKITDSTGDYDYELYSVDQRAHVRITKFIHDQPLANRVITDRTIYNKTRIQWNGLSFEERMQAAKNQGQLNLSFINSYGESRDVNTMRNRKRAVEIGFIEID